MIHGAPPPGTPREPLGVLETLLPPAPSSPRPPVAEPAPAPLAAEQTPLDPALSDAFTRSLDRSSDAALVALVNLGLDAPAARLRERHQDAVAALAARLAPADAAAVLDQTWDRLVDGVRLGTGLDVPIRVAWLSLVAQHVAGGRAPRPWVGGDAVWGAFLQLSPTWQAVLWHHEVEGDETAALAELVGAEDASVERWTRVARGALRREVVRRHLPSLTRAECVRVAGRLFEELGERVTSVDLHLLHAHGAGCEDCRLLVSDVVRVEQGLGDVLAARVLGAHAFWYASRDEEAAVAETLPEDVREAAPVVDPVVAPVVVPVVAPVPAAEEPAGEEPAAEEPAAEEPAAEEPAALAVPLPVRESHPSRPTPINRPTRPAATTRDRNRPGGPTRPAAAKGRRRTGNLLVGIAAAGVVGVVLLVLPGGDGPVRGDLEAGGPRSGRVAGTGTPDRVAPTGGAVRATPALATTSAGATEPGATDAGTTSATGGSTTPAVAPGPRPGPSQPPAGGPRPEPGPGPGPGPGPEPDPVPPTPEPEDPQPLVLSMDPATGSMTFQVNPPVGGQVEVVTPPLTTATRR